MRTLAPLFAVALLAGCAAPGPQGPGPHGPPPGFFPSAGPAWDGDPRPAARERRAHQEEMAGALRRFMERTERLEGAHEEVAHALRRFMERVERLEVAVKEGRGPDGPPRKGPDFQDALRRAEEARAVIEKKDAEIRRLHQVVDRLEAVIREMRSRLEDEEADRKERER